MTKRELKLELKLMKVHERADGLEAEVSVARNAFDGISIELRREKARIVRLARRNIELAGIATDEKRARKEATARIQEHAMQLAEARAAVGRAREKAEAKAKACHWVEITDADGKLLRSGLVEDVAADMTRERYPRFGEDVFCSGESWGRPLTTYVVRFLTDAPGQYWTYTSEDGWTMTIRTEVKP